VRWLDSAFVACGSTQARGAGRSLVAASACRWWRQAATKESGVKPPHPKMVLALGLFSQIKGSNLATGKAQRKTILLRRLSP